MSNRKGKTITGQAAFCFMLMDRIKGNIDGREKGGMERQHTKTAIQREITELRAALLELSKMID